VLAALLIVFREVFEAGLIVGIVMAVTAGVVGRGRWIAGGVAAGVLGACVVALFTGGLSELFGGSGQEVFNASILGFAVLMLTWHNVWMSRHGRELAAELRAAGEAVVAGSKSLAALAVVVAIAVLREGSEVVLFLYGVAAAQGGASFGMVVGGFLGLILGSSVCLMTYLGLVTIPTRYLFGVTSALIALLAAGMAAQAVAFLEQAGLLNALDQTVWDTSWILSDSSILGRALHTLIGYVDQPTAMQLVVYVATLAVIIVLMKLFAAPTTRRPRMAASQAVIGPPAK
jgi:high-affinity iron transporter